MKLYGPEPRWETVELSGGGRLVRAVCTAPDHSHVPPGGQCRCGQLGLGIVRERPEDQPGEEE